MNDFTYETKRSALQTIELNQRAKPIADSAFRRKLQIEFTLPKWLQPKLTKYYVLFWEGIHLHEEVIWNTKKEKWILIHQNIAYQVVIDDPEHNFSKTMRANQVALSFRCPKDTSIQPVVLIRIIRP